MATLSFTCPKCEKLHSRIKPEMAGHKVRCQCGFVFRLGPKTEKLPGVAEDIKRRRAVKDRKIATHQNAFVLKKPQGGEELLAPVEIDQPMAKAAPVEELLEPVEIAQPDELLDPIELDDLDELLQPVEIDQKLPSKISSTKTSAPPQIKESPNGSVNEPDLAQNAIEAKPFVEDLNEDDLLPDDEPLLSHAVLSDDHSLDDDSDEHVHTAELDPDESILDAIPIPTESYQAPDPNQPRFKQDASVPPILDQQIVAEAVPAYDPMTGVGTQAVADPLAGHGQGLPIAAPMPLPVGAPIRKPKHKSTRKKKTGKIALDSPAGPIASLVVAIMSAPIMMLLTFLVLSAFLVLLGIYGGFGDVIGSGTAHGNMVVAIIISALIGLLYLGLTICIIISGVTAVIEMAKNTYIGWGHKLAAIVASVVLVILFVSYVYQVGNFLYTMESTKQARQSMGGSVVVTNVSMGTFFIKTTLFSMGHALAPLAVAICGFIRGRK